MGEHYDTPPCVPSAMCQTSLGPEKLQKPLANAPPPWYNRGKKLRKRTFLGAKNAKNAFWTAYPN